MLKNQKEFIGYLDEVKTELEKADSSFEDIQKNTHASETLKQEIGEAELIVPVVGAFSAGKSTLINSFLGSDLLPVDVTPETALATELRYAESEYIEAIKKNDEADRYEIGESGTIKERAEQYQYVKVFLNSERLAEISPLVLVDMPGFDSPLDLHQRAVLTYLARGSYYAVLISVEEGTVTRSTHRQLSDFHEFEKGFSLFLSKANLKSDSDVRAITRGIEELLSDDFGLYDSVITVGKEGGNSLKKMLKALDPEELFDKIWRPSLGDHFFAVDGSLNTRINALEKDESENQEAIDELASALENLQRKKEEMVEDIHAKYSMTHIDIIVEGVGADLSNSVEELTDITVRGGEDALQRHLSEAIRTSLLSHTNKELTRLNEKIADDLSSSLEGIDAIFSSYASDGEWIKDIEHRAPIVIKQGTKVLSKTAEMLRGKWGLYRVATTALAVTTTVVIPVLELVIIFLPEIIDFFRKQKQEENIRNQLIGTTIPDIKIKIRSEFSEHFNEQVRRLINEQAESFDSQIKAKQSEIAEAEKVKQDKMRDIEQTIAQLVGIQDNIRSLANKVISTQ